MTVAFERNGYAEDRIYTLQGDYGRIQCQRPCTDQTWDSQPVINGLLPRLDTDTGKLPKAFIPACPSCGGDVFYNLRGGSWFVHTPYEKLKDHPPNRSGNSSRTMKGAPP